MGNKNSSFKKEVQKGRGDFIFRHSFRKNRNKLKKSITAPITANGTARQPFRNPGDSSEVGRSLPASPILAKYSPAQSSHSYTSPSGGNKLEVKIFRSYSNLNNAKKRNLIDETPTKIRIYKRSANNSEIELSAASNRMASRSYSLPRELCRNRGLRNSGVSSSTENFDNLSLKKTRRSALTSRSSTVSRLNSFSDPSSNAYRVKKSDFTNVETRKKKLKHFSNTLTHCITNSFIHLPHLTSLLPISIHPTPSSSFHQHPITLESFLGEADDVINEVGSNERLLYISKALFEDLKLVLESLKRNSEKRKSKPLNYEETTHAKSNPPISPNLSDLCRRILEETAGEVAREVCRVLEYQICLLSGNLTIETTARCVSERIFSYVMQQMKTPLIDHNSLLMGLLKGKVYRPQHPPPVASVIIGMKELKWNLYEVLDKAGLRRDTLLDHENFNGDLEPFTFYKAPFSDTMLYGYRGVLMEWDRYRGVYRQNPKEKETYEEEVLFRYDDFHRIYPPHFRAVGSDAFKKFASGDPSKVGSSLKEGFTNAFKETAYSLQDIDVIFYPTKEAHVDWNSACQFNRYLRPKPMNIENNGYNGNEMKDNKNGFCNTGLNTDYTNHGVSEVGSSINNDSTKDYTCKSSNPGGQYSPSSIANGTTNYPNTSTPIYKKTAHNGYYSNEQVTPPQIQQAVKTSQLPPNFPQKQIATSSPQQQLSSSLLQKPPQSPQRQLPQTPQQQPPQMHLSQPKQKPPPPPRTRVTLSSDECKEVSRSSGAFRENNNMTTRSSELVTNTNGNIKNYLGKDNFKNNNFDAYNNNFDDNYVFNNNVLVGNDSYKD